VELRIAHILFALACVASVSGVMAQPRLCTAGDTLLFGNQEVDSSRSQTATISNCGDQPWSLTDIRVDPATGAAFHVNGSCSAGLTLVPGASCTVTVAFAPTVPGQTSGGVWLDNTSSTPQELVVFYGRGIDARAGTATLSFSPTTLLFPAQLIGSRSAGVTVLLDNQGPAPLTPTALVFTGPAAYDYSAVGDCNLGSPIEPGKSCALTLFFLPGAAGDRPANLVVDSPQLANLAILVLDGSGGIPAAPDADVVEFFYPPLDTYFLTASAAEEAFIDAGGVGAGWVRTGFHFSAWAIGTNAPSTVPVCRFTGAPNVGPDSHFFTGDAAECALVQGNPYWRYEGLAFRTVLPASGQCVAGMTTVVRFYRPGNDITQVRHRYVIDAAEAEQMRAQGWLEEGPVFCAPP
jgi:hypothetical protein